MKFEQQQSDQRLLLLVHSQKKEWPYNLEKEFFGRELKLQRGPARRAAIIKEAAKQLIENVQACHKVGEWLCGCST